MARIAAWLRRHHPRRLHSPRQRHVQLRPRAPNAERLATAHAKPLLTAAGHPPHPRPRLRLPPKLRQHAGRHRQPGEVLHQRDHLPARRGLPTSACLAPSPTPSTSFRSRASTPSSPTPNAIRHCKTTPPASPTGCATACSCRLPSAPSSATWAATPSR